VTPADLPAERSHDPFCEPGVLAAIHALADFSHSKAMADLVTAGKWAPELLITLGKVAPPRYAHFIGRRKDDPDPSVRRAVAVGLGLMDNDAIAIPVLIQLLTRRHRGRLPCPVGRGRIAHRARQAQGGREDAASG
jgi:hypothetical protein